MLRDLYRRLHKHLSQNLNPTRIVAGSFGLIILVGTLLLMLPMASRNGESAGLITSLFTATSATCVTGLVVVDTWLNWTVFGQAVILLMIQLGGLGFMTVITLFSFVLHRRIGLSERLIMVSTLNLNDMDGVVRVVRHALMGTFLIEAGGAVILSLCFIPIFGVWGGIGRGIFHSISAFCNAGFDLMGGYSGAFSNLTSFTGHPVILFTIMALIIVGGLGFFVWEDWLTNRNWKSLSLYSKMVLVITGTLILGGALIFFCSEYHNPATLGGLPLGEKMLNALFQSVTLRTAGFNTLDQGGLLDSSLALSSIFMLIGGGSGSTAGGLKVVTVGVLLLALRAGVHGREEVTLRGRSVSHRRVMNAMTLTLMVVVIFLAASMVISLVEGVSYLDAAFETASAMGTVGLSTGITPGLSTFSHLLLICLMYTGRVGILSFSIAFLSRSKYPLKIKYPTFDLMIG